MPLPSLPHDEGAGDRPRQYNFAAEKAASRSWRSGYVGTCDLEVSGTAGSLYSCCTY